VEMFSGFMLLVTGSSSGFLSRSDEHSCFINADDVFDQLSSQPVRL
jgi:hypothetical protein